MGTPTHGSLKSSEDEWLLITCRMENPIYAVQVAPDYPIQVHEDNNTVTVQAGVTQRILLNFLASYKCATSHPNQAFTSHPPALPSLYTALARQAA